MPHWWPGWPCGGLVPGAVAVVPAGCADVFAGAMVGVMTGAGALPAVAGVWPSGVPTGIPHWWPGWPCAGFGVPAGRVTPPAGAEIGGVATVWVAPTGGGAGSGDTAVGSIGLSATLVLGAVSSDVVVVVCCGASFWQATPVMANKRPMAIVWTFILIKFKNIKRETKVAGVFQFEASKMAGNANTPTNSCRKQGIGLCARSKSRSFQSLSPALEPA